MSKIALEQTRRRLRDHRLVDLDYVGEMQKFSRLSLKLIQTLSTGWTLLVKSGVGDYGQAEMLKLYSPVAEEITSESCTEGLQKEDDVTNDLPCKSIKILTDARHSTRKNGQFGTVTAIGTNSHLILQSVTISKQEDPCSQRHEKLGTIRLYEHFQRKGYHIAVHAHDRNMSINKYVKDHHKDTINQNDTWHAGKSVEKLVKSVASGAQKNHGVTWHCELEDKIHSVRTSIHWALRNCERNPSNITASLENIPAHYMNQHNGCSPTARCRTDQNYMPSKQLLSDPVAIKLLDQAIKKSCVYKEPEDYIEAMDTFWVESFHNVMNMFTDK